MVPLSDGIPARRFPIVNVLLIVANFAVFIFYELPHLNTAVYHASFYPCSVDSACRAPEPWGLSWITAMFLHGGWDHILGNMLFLAIFGKNVEDAFGSLAYLVFYFAGGFAAMMTQACWQHGSWPGRDRQHPGRNSVPRRRPRDPLAATGEARRPWRRCASGVGSGIVNLVTTYQQ